MSAPGTVDIRPMTKADLESVLAIEQASFSHPWRHEHFLHELASPYSFPFVAVIEGAVGGYVCLMSLFEEAEILDIVVAPHLRGRGIARALLEHAVAIAQGKQAGIMRLEVRASNRAAIALYERSGFSRTGVRTKYYEGVEDALLMEKSLSTGC
ncbi:ribosomal-protein-alanine N-acetyltransferase [Oryzomonas sagensis]|uniref:[Ribosomal protein bS18]-alanine N-acetyltransferase n=1 Tax=Oryzomonas sagensis TaxID=2603857 RepID=A0ABQ6TKL8_9BACT|nr:ribosomal protein S18-alanine N-acetyltransferase [Oryzomonas sagensis]KAB0668699.1 ribosomal-protein-alanine N-acetyltransferase [Oryzomonas sagensis]